MSTRRHAPEGAGAGHAATWVSRRQALKGMGAFGLALGAHPFLTACHAVNETNVLLIVADDLRHDHLAFMPNVQRLIGDRGRTFTSARCNVALCQPSRVALHTGQTSRRNNEVGIGFSGTALKDHNNCLGRWMGDAGYRCGMFGKYINAVDGRGGIDAPAGYHTWREIIGERNGYDFTVHLNTGTRTVTGQYATDYLAAEANSFIAGGHPFFAVVTPMQPHAPFSPRADLADDWLGYEWSIVDEVDVSDKPPWIQGLAPFTDADRAAIRSNVVGALQEITAVDDMVARIIGAMGAAVLEKTVVIFTSDNGVHHGEHRRREPAAKAGPYEVALRVPLVIRGPGFPPGPAIDAPVLAFQDIVATIVDIGVATPGLPHQAGTSLRALCSDPGAHAPRALLHEIGQGYFSTGDGVTTGPAHADGYRKLYRYPSIRVAPDGPFTYEAYDLDTDPDELSNWAEDPARRPERDALEDLLRSLLAG